MNELLLFFRCENEEQSKKQSNINNAYTTRMPYLKLNELHNLPRVGMHMLCPMRRLTYYS